MARRRRSSGGFINFILRFFGISSPAVLLMAAMSYFGFRMPVPDGPSDSPEALAKRARQIVDAAAAAKDKIKERIKSFGSTDDETPAKPAADDESLQHVTYQELFVEDKPASYVAPPAIKMPPPLKTPPIDRTPKISDNRDRKKGKYDDDFPEFNTYR